MARHGAAVPGLPFAALALANSSCCADHASGLDDATVQIVFFGALQQCASVPDSRPVLVVYRPVAQGPAAILSHILQFSFLSLPSAFFVGPLRHCGLILHFSFLRHLTYYVTTALTVYFHSFSFSDLDRSISLHLLPASAKAGHSLLSYSKSTYYKKSFLFQLTSQCPPH